MHYAGVFFWRVFLVIVRCKCLAGSALVLCIGLQAVMQFMQFVHNTKALRREARAARSWWKGWRANSRFQCFSRRSNGRRCEFANIDRSHNIFHCWYLRRQKTEIAM